MKAIIKAILQTLTIIFLAFMILISTFALQEKMQPKQTEVKIYKHYDKDENMLCYYNNLGGMSCVWSMEDL
ncbi:hypothetical protein [Providencia phage PSTCR7]|uniref:Uncharacterized protein n=1 Tax=Providencia phage PSTCR7 TaxID=2783549 RepID=A0A7S9XIA2_9CAUD|nr:hypothetical protein PQD10_gp30 [Providencia phage PSTCR7]QPI18482.1 hypothetical protein [Providencia phage PSTCR7]